MNFEEFKDEAVLTVLKDKLKGRILDGTPIYILAKENSNIIDAGGLDVHRGNLHEFTSTVRRIISSQKFDYAGIAVFSEVANTKNMDEEEMNKLRTMNSSDMRNYLKERNMLNKSISIRVENNLDKDQNSMLNFLLDNEMGVIDDVEIFDKEMDDSAQLGLPFGGNIFK